jgi:uncharacterized protein YciI
MADPNNPSGALPGDPRHGLSEAALKEYYRTKSPTWFIRAILKSEGGIEARAEAMEPHLAYLRASRNEIRFAGPLLEDDGETPRGSLTLIDLPNRAAAEAWLASEPYNLNEAFAEKSFTRWSSSMEHRQLDYPRTEGWRQFVITAFDGPDGEARRRAVGEAHHKFQASVMDRYIARGPLLGDDGEKVIGSLMIVEFPDRAAFDAFWAAEPLNTGGVFESVTIECWRYGKAIG